MGVTTRWKGLTETQRRVIIVGVVLETAVKVGALRDLKRRPADQVRGPRWLWAGVIALSSSAGLVPAAYLVLGRRRH